MSAAPSVVLIPYLGHGDDGAAAWARLVPDDRRRTAMQAARDHDGPALWSLTEAWLRTFGPAGATVSPGTVRSYRCGVHALLAAWTAQDLLRPDLEAATTYSCLLERRGLAPSTIQARGAARPHLLVITSSVAARRGSARGLSCAQARPVAGDEPGEPVRYAVALHIVMSRDELDLWQTFADRHWLEVDDAVHVAALSGLTYQLGRDGDAVGRHAAEVCAWELIARLGLEGCVAPQRAGPGRT
jgi:hypothetical protein